MRVTAPASVAVPMSSILFGDTMVPNIAPIMENQMEKTMENEMETGIIGLIGGCITDLHLAWVLGPNQLPLNAGNQDPVAGGQRQGCRFVRFRSNRCSLQGPFQLHGKS